MNWIEALSNPEIKDFIRAHVKEKPADLALKAAKYPGIPIKLVVQQIQARQKAKVKLPSWEASEEVIFPPALSMEQCSSEQTARFKAQLVEGNHLVDLTGGFGVDTYYFSQQFGRVDYVERQEALVVLAAHNMKALNASHVRTHQMEAEGFLEQMSEKADVIYLDPARRGDHNEKVFLLSDCEPDVSRLLPQLLDKAEQVLIKTSPMLDINRALSELYNVDKIVVLAVDNECKEVLYRIGHQKDIAPEITCINMLKNGRMQSFTFSVSEENQAGVELADPMTYIYEPNVAIMKAGPYKRIGEKFGLKKLHAHSHLYTSEKLAADFPGRIFELEAVCSLNKKELLKRVPSKKANITVRNFPQSVKDIRKKTGLKEGGEHYLLATTNQEGKPVILVTKRQGLGKSVD